jgi:integrase
MLPASHLSGLRPARVTNVPLFSVDLGLAQSVSQLESDACSTRRRFRQHGLDAGRVAAQLRFAAQRERSDLRPISLLVGHKSAQVTEIVYRRQLRPMRAEEAEAMDNMRPANG